MPRCGRVAVVFPGTGRQAVKGVGSRLLTALFSMHGCTVDVFCTRDPVAGRSLIAGQAPSEFDMLVFTLYDETTYLDLAWFVRTYVKEIAQPGHRAPAIVAGGGVLTLNPRPVLPLVDLACIGDAECLVPLLATAAHESVGGALSGRSSLHGPGFLRSYADPAMCQPVWSEMISMPWHDRIPSYLTQTDYIPVEIARGCPNACTFCQTPASRGPYREASLEDIGEYLRSERLARPAANSVRLLAASPSEYSRIDGLAELCDALGCGVSLSSVRVDDLLRHPELIDELQGRVRLGVETGTDERRMCLGKQFTNQDVIAIAQQLSQSQRVDRITLYFLIGIPHERESDIHSIARLVRDVASRSSKPVDASLSVMIPEPGTPLELYPMVPLNIARRAWQDIADSVKGVACVSSDTRPEDFYITGVLSRGDSTVAAAILAATERGLTVRSHWEEWVACYEYCNVNWERVLYEAV